MSAQVMASARRVLLVLFEGLPGTVIESQVLVHAREMVRLGIADFEIWTVACSQSLFRLSQEAQQRARELAGCEVRVVRGVRPAIPFSTILNALLLAAVMLRHRPSFDVLHARTDYSACVAGLLKLLRRFVLIWDCRGDAVSEFLDQRKSQSWLGRMMIFGRARLLAYDRTRAAKRCDRAIFVTSILQRLAQPAFGGKPYRVIPGTGSAELFFFDHALRAKIRKELGLQQEERLYIFSGSLAPYQGFDQMLEVFTTIRSQDPQARLLLLTPAIDAARRKMMAHDIDVILRSAAIDDVNGYLNAADVAFMLRESTGTNQAAFPTKFSEYCLAGLPVIMTDAVPDACRVAERLQNYVQPPIDGKLMLPEGYDRQKVADAARNSLTRQAVAPLYRDIYSQPIPD